MASVMAGSTRCHQRSPLNHPGSPLPYPGNQSRRTPSQYSNSRPIARLGAPTPTTALALISLVHRRARAPGGDDPEGHGGDHGDQKGEHRELRGELDPVGQQGGHRLVTADRAAEVPADDAADPVPVLGQERVVEVVLGSHPGQRLGARRARPEQVARRVPRSQMEQAEHDERHRHQQGNGGPEADGDETPDPTRTGPRLVIAVPDAAGRNDAARPR